MRQTRLWRVINSAQWVAWGVVQAKVPGMEEGIAVAEAEKAGHENNNGNGNSNGSTEHHPQSEHNSEAKAPAPEAEVDADDFDYLAYAQDRAMIFWADMLAFGLVKEDELPGHVVEHVKTRVLEY